MDIDPVEPLPITPPPAEEVPPNQLEETSQEVSETPPKPEDTGEVVDEYA